MKKVAYENSTFDKLECVIGDFNDLKVPDNSLDFVLDFDSIHHSEDFELTFKEIGRVLKPVWFYYAIELNQTTYLTSRFRLCLI